MKTGNKTRAESTPAIEARVARLRKKARNYLLKSEIMQFRLDQKSYEALFSIAERERKPAGTLVREWVTARIKQEADPNLRGQSALSTSEVRAMIRQEVAAALKKQQATQRNP